VNKHITFRMIFNYSAFYVTNYLCVIVVDDVVTGVIEMFILECVNCRRDGTISNVSKANVDITTPKKCQIINTSAYNRRYR